MPASRDWFEKDFYGILGVAETASADEIKRAFKKLARDSHPDRHPGDARAEERFKQVNEAYDVLGHAEKRAEYDQVRAHSSGCVGPLDSWSGPSRGHSAMPECYTRPVKYHNTFINFVIGAYDSLRLSGGGGGKSRASGE